MNAHFPPHILIVDDDRSSCALLANALVRHGYDVDVALDGFEALELAEHFPYDLALLDYQMPGMDGIQLLQRIRHLHPDIHGIIQTAYARIDTIFPAVGSGAARVLSKPIDTQELVDAVEKLVGGPADDSRYN